MTLTHEEEVGMAMYHYDRLYYKVKDWDTLKDVMMEAYNHTLEDIKAVEQGFLPDSYLSLQQEKGDD